MRFSTGMNLLISSPGRLLQHMDETPYFDCSQLKMLVLDEADRILDMVCPVPLLHLMSVIPCMTQLSCAVP